MDQAVLDSLNSIKKDIEVLNEELLDCAKCRTVPLSVSDELDTILKTIDVDDLLNNMDKLTELHSTIMTNKQKQNDIIKYHMMNKSVNIDSINSLTEAINLTKKLLNLYHMNIGGFNLEDCSWNFHDSTSTLFKLNESTVVFSNSMRRKLVNDIDSITFVRDVTTSINKYLGDNIEASWKKIYDDRHDINWIIIALKDIGNDKKPKENAKEQENNNNLKGKTKSKNSA